MYYLTLTVSLTIRRSQIKQNLLGSFLPVNIQLSEKVEEINISSDKVTTSPQFRIKKIINNQIIFRKMIHTALLIFAVTIYVCSVSFLYLKDFLPNGKPKMLSIISYFLQFPLFLANKNVDLRRHYATQPDFYNRRAHSI